MVLAERLWRPTGVLATLNLSRHVRKLTDPNAAGAAPLVAREWKQGGLLLEAGSQFPLG